MARRIPSLNALRAFEAAGRHGRMTLAADELAVTHSAVSRQVQHLENVLGVPLFEGPKNGLRLTEAGTRLLSGLVSAFDQIDMAVRQVADMPDGPLDVSCPGTFTMRWLIPRLYRFQAAHPGIEVRLTSSSRPVDFARDGFDVAIRVGAGPWPQGAEVVPLFGEQTGPVLAPALAQSAPRDLAGVAVLHSRTRRRAWPDWCARSGTPGGHAPGIEYEHFYFMLEAASAGLGVCIAPWPFVADDVRSGRLAAPRGFIASGQDYVALRRARRHRKSSLFCAWLQDEARDFAAAPPGS
ncbi:LysR substrate-binding domain-containing protein [Labrys wisconsinensis]|uniref:DNA-binding transcriptional LysR family regulator n=1 Tax=Labrys wisconsinensis TaxID=425677 RepID=A0ABU0JJ01_9HYPH|nr:LysR substrate-binding domain-containing protein [Labrys wisconsinensis]MDQ0474264.1 DNA-binding transcriptional LysR family regulator [Labrys wisconsinensis]